MSAIFNGTNQAKYGDSGLQYQYGINCSCLFWFKTDHDFSTSPTQALPFGIRNGTVINYAHIDLFGGINAGFVGWSFGTTTQFDQFTDNVGGHNDNEWHSMVLTRDGVTTKFFLDGAEVTYANITDSLQSTQVVSTNATYGSVSIGARQNDADPFDNYFPGKIAEVALWSRTLSDVEAATLHTNTADTLSTSLDHYWPLLDDNLASVGTEDLTDWGPAGTFDAADHPYSAAAPGIVGSAPSAARRQSLNAALWYNKMAKQREQSLKAQEEYFKKIRR